MKSVVLENTVGIPAEEILGRKHNLWVGVSDSTWFNTPDNFELAIRWGLDHTRDKLLLWMPGRLYAMNIRHIERRSRARSLRDGFTKEHEFRSRAEQMLTQCSAEERGRVCFVDYDRILTPLYVERRSVLYREYSLENDFYRRVDEIVEGFLAIRGRTASKERKEAVAIFVIQELPMFVEPVRLIDSEDAFAVEIYPGTGKVDQLALDLVEGKLFPEITEKLRLKDPCGVASIKLAED